MTFPMIVQPSLPPNTIVPEEDALFIPYFNRLYEDIAFTVNNKDNTFFQIPITSSATSIPNLPNFGAFIVCVSGTDSTLPTITASLCKSSAIVAGSIAVLGSQVGTAAWAGNTLTITSTATNFQIAHNRASVNANFNIRIVGTQD
jgi:hypothetical protein